jgi:hypothetical protein
MEDEFNDRIKTTKTQYDLVQKQLNTLTNTFNQTNQKLSSVQINETNVTSFHSIHASNPLLKLDQTRN